MASSSNQKVIETHNFNPKKYFLERVGEDTEFKIITFNKAISKIGKTKASI